LSKVDKSFLLFIEKNIPSTLTKIVFYVSEVNLYQLWLKTWSKEAPKKKKKKKKKTKKKKKKKKKKKTWSILVKWSWWYKLNKLTLVDVNK